MDLYFYTKRLDLAATTLADLASLISALADEADATNAATIDKVTGKVQPLIQSDSGEPLRLYFYDDASTVASFVSDSAVTLAIGLGFEDANTSWALASTTATAIVSGPPAYRTATLPLNTTRLRDEVSKWMGISGSGRIPPPFFLQIRKTESGNTETVARLRVQVRPGVLSTAPVDDSTTQTARDDALQYRNEASGFRDQAAASASEASSSASTATTQAGIATAQAAAAATSATTATTQAGIATTQATAAAASAATAAAIAAGVNYQGYIAASALPANSTSGLFWIVSTAGTIYGKTFAVGDAAIWRAASTYDQVPASVVFSIAPPLRNALAPRGGVAFDGTAGNSLSVTLTNQNIGGDPMAVCVTHRVPTTNPPTARVLAYIGPSATSANVARTFRLELAANGYLYGYLIGATTADYRYFNIPYVSAFGGKTVQIAVSRPASGDIEVRIDGVLQVFNANSFGGTDPTWQGIITSTCFVLGRYDASNFAWVGPIFSATLYNCSLTSADVQEIYELGGAVPERFKFGSQTELVTNGDFSSSAGWVLDSNWTIGAGKLTATAPVGNYAYRTVAGLVSGKTYKATFTLSNYAAGAVKPWIQLGSTVVFGSQRSANGTYSENLTAPVGTTNNFCGLAAQTSAFQGDIDDFSVKQVGAVVHLPLNDGGGFQLRNLAAASNGTDHALMTTSGVSHVLPLNGPFHARFTSNTNGNLQLGGQVIIPANAQILRIRARARTGTPTVQVGSASGGAQFVASFTFPGNTWRDLTLVGGWITTTASTSLWVNSNSTDIIEWDITWEPLSI